MTTENTALSTEKQRSHLLTDSNYQLLTKTQRDISEETGYSPNMTILLDEILTGEVVNESVKRIEEKLAQLA